jgi:hypothetical protein
MKGGCIVIQFVRQKNTITCKKVAWCEKSPLRR